MGAGNLPHKAELKTALDEFIGTFQDIHWPDDNDRHGEDHSFSGEGWADVMRRSNEAEKIAHAKVGAVVQANRALKTAQSSAIDERRKLIAQMDRSVARAEAAV